MTQVHRLDEARVDEAAALMARAFFDYPMWQWVLPDEEHRRRALPISTRASIRWGLLLGESYALSDPMRGLAIWAPAGMADRDVDPDGSKTDWASVVEAIGPEGIHRFDQMIEAQRPVRERYMDARTWYLPWLGVDPASQRAGVGTSLLHHMFARLDPQGIATFLETEREANVAYYLKHGYEIVHEGVLPDGGPGYWCFLRRPPGSGGP